MYLMSSDTVSPTRRTKARGLRGIYGYLVLGGTGILGNRKEDMEQARSDNLDKALPVSQTLCLSVATGI